MHFAPQTTIHYKKDTPKQVYAPTLSVLFRYIEPRSITITTLSFLGALIYAAPSMRSVIESSQTRHCLCNCFTHFSMLLAKNLKIEHISIQVAERNILKMSEIVSCANLFWKFYENPFIIFPVMLLIDTELRLVWSVKLSRQRWNRRAYVFVSFCRGVASCDLQGKHISCQKYFMPKRRYIWF